MPLTLLPLTRSVARNIAALRLSLVANDNPPAAQDQDFVRRALQRDARRHFAAHGPGAAELARSNAEDAFFAGRHSDYLRWTAICQALDRHSLEAAGAALLTLR